MSAKPLGFPRDPFFVPPDIIPAGMSYQWCAVSCLGEPSPQYAFMVEGGWSPVPRHRHPHHFTKSESADWIDIGGQRLMCRLIEISEHAQQINEDKAHRNAMASSRLVRVGDLKFSLSASEMRNAEMEEISCRQYALRQIKGMADGVLPHVSLRGEIGPYGATGALIFVRDRRPRHRWLQWLFNLITTE